ncbi:hypothetical protein K435DRAFT_967153 [Dendrothele bispora CBS 962.96]|uniref:Protein kinase domain-containing protein n=1 Tax=Dendrothele bispora (strain CBS 962.96) TaxID=1314807 RepID=A0A4S8LX83_DENBC|nr:hypothetical protein K435DRAFT_967153 [Dendrothele bispora CBS 962.96]
MSRSNFFENNSHSSFEGSHIINVAGDNITQIIGPQDQIVSNGAHGESIFNQYQDLRRCDIRLLQKLSTTEIDEAETSLWSDRRNLTQKKLKYTRTTHSISLFGVATSYSHCVAMHYSGRDAYAAWERDLLKYSNHHQNVVHLFGLNREKSNPALVFCDDVVPWAQIWEKCTSIAKCYLDVCFDLARWNFPGSMGGLSFANESFNQGAVFVRRDTGMICFGSQSRGEMDSQLIKRRLPWPFSALLSEEPDKTLPFDLFHDETRTLEYLLGIPEKHSLSQQIITSSPFDILNFLNYV